MLFNYTLKLINSLIFDNNSQFLEIYIIFEINLNFNLYHTLGLLGIFTNIYPRLKSIFHGYKISDSTNVKLSSEMEKSHWIKCKDLKCAFFLQILGTVLIPRRSTGFFRYLISSKTHLAGKFICSRRDKKI